MLPTYHFTPLHRAPLTVRNRIRMAISLACGQLLSDAGFQVPLIWKDAFTGLNESEKESLTGTLERFSERGHQVLLLTSDPLVRRFWQKENLPVLDLPDRYSGDRFPVPPREGRPAEPAPSPLNWFEVNYQFDLAAMDQHPERMHLDFPSDDWQPDRTTQTKEIPSTLSLSPTQFQSGKTPGAPRYYLQLSSDVEAAPTIGPKMAERLAGIEIHTVADLLKQTARHIARSLKHRPTKTEHVLQWQKQALLVCEVPNLRGHDAQLLVACGIEESSQLAAMDAESLFRIIGPFSETRDGRKLLRGSNPPDLAEVQQWVACAQMHQNIQESVRKAA